MSRRWKKPKHDPKQKVLDFLRDKEPWEVDDDKPYTPTPPNMKEGWTPPEPSEDEIPF